MFIKSQVVIRHLCTKNVTSAPLCKCLEYMVRVKITSVRNFTTI